MEWSSGMKVIVGIQRVIDYKTPIRVKADESGVETANVKMAMNPFDEIAVEAAVRWKEQGIATEVLAVALGTDANQEILRTALAMGVDRALLMQTNEKIQSLAAAKILQAVALKENPDVIILGKQSIDNDNNQTGQMLAGLLSWPQGTFASKIEFVEGRVNVSREIDGGLETLSLRLPAVITTDLRLNEPRFISLPNIMQAKKKTIETLPLSDLNVDIKPHLIIKRVTPPPPHRAGIKVNSVSELLQKLKSEARVL
jgi:electron transfer flavoprotein beta subunit